MKKNYIFLAFFMLFGIITSNAQTDTLSLDAMLEETPAPKMQLLPDRMQPTQYLLWGKKGLMRITGISPLDEKHRTVELKIRRSMLITHQVVGYATLAGMIAQGIVGGILYKRIKDNSDYGLKPLHKNIGKAVNIAYFTDASLSFFSPPPLISNRTVGLNSIKIHKGLAYLHLSAMIATNVFSYQIRNSASSYDYKPIHRASAYTAFGAFAAAMIVMKF